MMIYLHDAKHRVTIFITNLITNFQIFAEQDKEKIDRILANNDVKH